MSGRIINSACLVGQIQGAVAQSISYATDESMHFAKAEYIATKNDNTECPFVDKDSGEAPVPLPLAVIVSTLANDIGKLTRQDSCYTERLARSPGRKRITEIIPRTVT